MAGGQPTDPRALHADLRILAEPGRGLVRDHREAGHPPWNLRIGTRPHRQDPSVHQRLEQPMPPIRVDQDGRPNPPETNPSKDLPQGPLVRPVMPVHAATVIGLPGWAAPGPRAEPSR